MAAPKKRKRVTKEEFNKPSEGLGDTVEKVFKATGIDKVAKFILGEDCGCDERKAKLNEMFRYAKVECLTEDEFTYLSSFEWKTATLNHVQQRELIKIKNRIFNLRDTGKPCSTCWADVINELKKVYDEYDTTV